MDAAPTRRLAAVMAADIVGYSRLMHSDEDRTLADLAAFRQKTFAPQVATHRGRVVKSMGDGWLVEFPAAADALACATALQTALAGQDRLQLRIGLHVGDVVLAGDDLFGDGVNIAARLEALARPGAVLMSEDAYRLTARRGASAFRSLGAHRLKNIADPVTVYGWAPDMERNSHLTADTQASGPGRGLPTIFVTTLDIAGDRDAATLVAEDFRYEMIHLLSRRTGIRILSEGDDAAMPDYRLTGRCRVAGSRARIDIALMSGNEGSPLWTDRFEGPADDPDALVAQAARRVSTVFRTITITTAGAALADTPDNELSFAQLLAKASHHSVHYSPEHIGIARAAIAAALALEPLDPMANAMFAASSVQALYTGTLSPDELDIPRIMAHADRAVSGNPSSDFAYLARAQARLWLQRDYDGARADVANALRVNPDFAWADLQTGLVDLFTGETARAADAFAAAIRTLDRDPVVPICLACLALSQMLEGDPDSARRTAQNAYDRGPFIAFCAMIHLILAPQTATQGAANADLVARLGLSTQVLHILPFSDRTIVDALLERARAAGIPD